MNREPLHDLLRAYVLNTASDRERAEVERLLAERPDVRDALDVERRRLAVLDRLDALEPARDLVAAVDARIAREGAHAPRATRRWQLPFSVAAVALVVVIAIPALSRAREAARRATSQNNLKQFGLIMKMYSGENAGKYPPLAPYDGVWMADLRYLIPEYVTDVSIFFNPSAPDAEELTETMAELLAQEPVDWERVHRVAAQHYVYPGWVITQADELHDFTQGFRRLARNEHTDEIVVGERRFLRPREGVERFLITDINNPAGSASAQSTIPIMFEHIPAKGGKHAGINVLYMDGHVEFKELGHGEFPAITETQYAFPPPPLERLRSP